MEKRSHLVRAAAVACAFAWAGCGSGSSGVSVVPGALTVVSVSPGDGATDVEPDQGFTVTFSLPVDDIPDGSIVVSDRAGELAGTLTAVDRRAWRWVAEPTLPRGATLTLEVRPGLRSRSGDLLTIGYSTTFTVREAVHRTSALGASVSTASPKVFVWPQGRRAGVVYGYVGAATVPGSVFAEVPHGAGSPSQLPIVVPFGARLYGDGWWVNRFANAVQHRSLDGDWIEVALPQQLVANPAAIADVNSHGDVVVLRAPPGAFELWRVRRSTQDVEFLFALPAAASAPRASIGEDGTVWAGYRDTAGRPVVARSMPNGVPSTGTPLLALPPEYGVVGEVACGVAADGVATMVWIENGATLRAATIDAGGYVTVLAGSPVSSLPTGSGMELNVAQSGTAVVVLSHPASFENEFLRLERTGWLGAPQPFSGTSSNYHFEPTRGEWWWLKAPYGQGDYARRRSRPGERLDEESTPFVASGWISSFTFGFDRYGRALFGVTGYYEPSDPFPNTHVFAVE